MYKIIQKLFLLFNSRERKQAILLMFAMIFMALLEVVGISLVLPFMALVIMRNYIITYFFNLFSVFFKKNLLSSSCNFVQH